ncbi:MAG: hypothetical protein ABFS12_14395 [Bacteroidota bacterium]
MGQQQLLLLVLGVIIVGIAVVAGIGMFNAAAEESVKDECVAQLLAIGANAQQWYKKPVSMSGGGGAFSTANGALGPYAIPDRMQWTSSAGIGNMETGVAGTAGYTITAPGAAQITVTADPNDYTWTFTAVITPHSITTLEVAATP